MRPPPPLLGPVMVIPVFTPPSIEFVALKVAPPENVIPSITAQFIEHDPLATLIVAEENGEFIINDLVLEPLAFQVKQVPIVNVDPAPMLRETGVLLIVMLENVLFAATLK
jgi:hypothetical protein